jgi:hypothetical protein
VFAWTFTRRSKDKKIKEEEPNEIKLREDGGNLAMAGSNKRNWPWQLTLHLMPSPLVTNEQRYRHHLAPRVPE